MPELQEIARVTIDPETIKLAEKPLTAKRRKELKRERVLDYIRNKPYGQKMGSLELVDVLGIFKSTGGAWMYLKSLVRDGYITEHPISLKRSFYTVNEPVTITKSAKDKHVLPATPVIEKPQTKAETTQPNLETLAMQFAWQHPLFNNDLREFVKWYSANHES